MVDKNRSLVEMYRYSVIVVNNIIVPLVLAGHKMIEANLHVRESLVISYLTSAKEITVDLERTHFSREWEY